MSVFFVRHNENSQVFRQKHWLILFKRSKLVSKINKSKKFLAKLFFPPSFLHSATTCRPKQRCSWHLTVFIKKGWLIRTQSVSYSLDLHLIRACFWYLPLKSFKASSSEHNAEPGQHSNSENTTKWLIVLGAKVKATGTAHWMWHGFMQKCFSYIRRYDNYRTNFTTYKKKKIPPPQKWFRHYCGIPQTMPGTCQKYKGGSAQI